MQATPMSRFEHIAPDTARAVSPFAIEKALAGLLTQHLVITLALTTWPNKPRIEPAARDTERLTDQRCRPGSCVLRHEAELHVDSLAK